MAFLSQLLNFLQLFYRQFIFEQPQTIHFCIHEHVHVSVKLCYKPGQNDLWAVAFANSELNFEIKINVEHCASCSLIEKHLIYMDSEGTKVKKMNNNNMMIMKR